jgi:PAS domain S-box-containing protein
MGTSPIVSGVYGIEPTGPPASCRRELADDAGLADAMAEAASEGLVVLTSEGLILRANRAAAEMIGHDHDGIVGQSIQDLLSKTTFDASLIGEIIATSLAVSRTYDFADGRSILVLGRPVPGDGARVVLALCDVTRMRQLVSRTQGVARQAKPAWPEMRRTATKATSGAPVVTSSMTMEAVREKALRCATVDSPVMLVGETGTGKGVFAELIHEASARCSGPFYVVNCGAIPEGLLEAELFGYSKGAFTGAAPRGKTGLIELAHNGTLLLDEIGDMPLGLQVKLLRFLESGEVWPVGASKGKHPDVRIIAATNRDIDRMIDEGAFRRDLYYRLHVLSIQIPPLREHPEDIPPLVAMMLEQLERKVGMRKRISRQALEMICRLPLPGNVRELWNLVESLVVTTLTETIEVTDLPGHAAGRQAASSAALKREDSNLRDALRQVEAQILQETLHRYGTQSKAARHLGVSQATIARKAKRYDLSA